MRKEAFITLVDDGKQLTFKITQMSATQQENWINRLVTLLVSKNATSIVNLQKMVTTQKYEELLSLLSGIKYEDVKPLYDELLTCASHVPNPQNKGVTIPCTLDTIDGIISDFKNLYVLRLRALEVCFDFFAKGDKPQEAKEADITIPKNM